MGNRSHNMIDRLPAELKEAINNAIVNERLTYKEITEMVNNAGHPVSSKTVERYGKKFLSKLESITRAKEQAKTILETSAGLKLDMAEASSMMAFQLLMDMLVNASGEVPDKGTLNAIKTLASLERSAVGREKLKYQYDKGVNTAADKIKESLKEELQNNQDLFEKLSVVVDNIASEMTKA
ncbi:MAG TPA: hypothetical protein DC000_02680 [Clostridiales bacterium]|nr:hypothetical protein [Clostridiales bacterium]